MSLTAEELDAAGRGMLLALHARRRPERLALDGPGGPRSFATLNAGANRLARALRARGLRAGDAVALLCSNRAEFVEALYATLRAGLRLTPVNWHLTAEEIGYVVRDCEARAVLADARFAAAATRLPEVPVRLAIGGAIDGFESYDSALAAASPEDIADPQLGAAMIYTSGTTGRPKGVLRAPAPPERALAPYIESAGFRAEGDLALLCGPLYHTAPLRLGLMVPLSMGVGAVLMDRWEAEAMLALVAERRCTHTHVVPTMFYRLAALPDAVRSAFDLTSLRWVLHGAAPCPPELKARMIGWLGPVVWEYYAGTEGSGTLIGPADWLARPGSVGRPVPGVTVRILDDEGRAVPDGTEGTVYIRAAGGARFEYFKDPAKTAATYRGELFTMGDVGRLDAEGHLHLTGRSAEVIISGGVNIYPTETDAALLAHPAVADAAAIGVPDPEWGEAVKAVVVLRAGERPSSTLADAIIGHCRTCIAAYKCPRSVDFVEALPRTGTGKLQRHLLRAGYWPARSGTG